MEQKSEWATDFNREAISHVWGQFLQKLENDTDQNRGYEPVPIIRNKIAAAFFRNLRIESRISDIAADDDGLSALSDLDAVVIAARTHVEWNPPRQAEDIKKIGKTFSQAFAIRCDDYLSEFDRGLWKRGVWQGAYAKNLHPGKAPRRVLAHIRM